MNDDIAFLSITALRRAFRRKALSPVAVMETALGRLERIEPRINAFVHRLDAEPAMARARAAEARWHQGAPLGPLDGVPVVVKDAIIARGWATLRGSRTADRTQPDAEDAPAVARLREAGAIILGKTTTPEYGWKGVTDSPLSGITRNPWNLGCTPGGSSGGSSAAVAAGIGHAGIGTDAAGSVRIPCAFTGLVALKATVGRIPTFPPSAVGPLGHIGPMTRTVADAALLATLMTQDDPRDWLAITADGADYGHGLEDGVEGLRIAYSPTLGYAKVDPEVAAIVERAAKAFTDLGAEVELVEAPFPDPTDCFWVHFATGLRHSIRNATPAQRALLDQDMLAALDRIGPIDLTRFMEANDQRTALGRSNRLFHRRYDLLLTPSLAVPAFPVGRLSPEGWDQGDWASWTPFTYPFNLTGQPACTVPCGFTAAGLPVGLQVVGALRADDLVLRAARAYEAAHPTTGRRPPI